MMASVESNNSPTVAAAAAAAAAAISPSDNSSTVARVASSPWTQIVKGPESEVPSTSSAAADQNHTSSAAAESSIDNAGSKKPAWGKNPASESGGSEVMGAKVWPPLSESTKVSQKLSPSNSSKSLVDLGSSTSPPPTPQSESVSPSENPIASSENHNASPNIGRPTRQRSIRRDGAGNSQTNGGFSHQHSGRDNMPNHSNRDIGTRNPSGDHSHLRNNSFRRGNNGPHYRGDGSHQNYGMRRGDQDRGTHDWNQRHFNGRDSMPMPRGGPRGFVRPGPVPFAHPSGPAPVPIPPIPAPMRPFMNPMGVPDMSMYYYPQNMPFVTHVHPQMYFPIPDLHAKIVKQIDYYFSDENLVRDTYLRMSMDKEGWVSIRLIVGFRKIRELTDDIQLVLRVLRSNSNLTEVKGEKVRRRGDFMRWIMAPSMEFLNKTSIPTLSAQIQGVRLDG